jgi:phenylpyruvate tautomerase PptA (4-oxalocrotonate tautomerase family)
LIGKRADAARHLKLASGRSQQQKEQIAAEVTKAIMATANVGEDAAP